MSTKARYSVGWAFATWEANHCASAVEEADGNIDKRAAVRRCTASPDPDLMPIVRLVLEPWQKAPVKRTLAVDGHTPWLTCGHCCPICRGAAAVPECLAMYRLKQSTAFEK